MDKNIVSIPKMLANIIIACKEEYKTLQMKEWFWIYS